MKILFAIYQTFIPYIIEGVIRLPDQHFDLCDEVKKIGKECPFSKGPQDISHTASIPREAPPV
jgi:hypothetical protein